MVSAAGKGSCVGRCGGSFTRSQRCSCELSCLQYLDCCPDFQKVCTGPLSCHGRCGEVFTRGRPCDCDAQCVNSNTCCHNYHQQCSKDRNTLQLSCAQNIQSAAPLARRKPNGSRRRSNSESEERYNARNACPGSHCKRPVSQSRPSKGTNGRAPPPLLTGPLRPELNSIASGAHHAGGDPGAQVNIHLVLSPPAGVAGLGPRPNTLEDLVRALGIKVVDSPGTGVFADHPCSDAPINGLTALPNGTILIFKGQHFWSVDPLTRTISRPQSITRTLGVPAPIDTVFTRSNCAGTTYIIKGDLYWRLDDSLRLEPGFPKPLSAEFPGQTRVVSAVLAVPASLSRPETLYFFYQGDTMQMFTYPAGSTPTCSLNTTAPTPFSGPAELLQRELNIRVSMKGFPLPVTSALSIPRPLRSNTYEHYVFSGPLFFSVEVSSDLPVVVEPDPSAELTPLLFQRPQNTPASVGPPQPPNSIAAWLQCAQ
ncbi:proteoglycan 4a [Synchiropus picturatus]